jgi:hypothetical protein
VLQRRHEVERHDAWSVNRLYALQVHGADRLHQLAYPLPNVGFIGRVWCGHD